MSLFWTMKSLFTPRGEERCARARRPLLGLAALGLTAISCHGAQPPAESTARDAPEAMTSANPSPAPTTVTSAASAVAATAAPEATAAPPRRRIETPEAARRLARAVASDILHYNREEVEKARDSKVVSEKLAAEIAEGRALFESRVAPELHGLYPAAIDEIIPLLPGSSAPAPENLDRATRALPPTLLAALTGCWETDDHAERWQIDRSSASELTVTRHVETDVADYARRAKIPSPLLYEATKGTLGFTAAGPLHALFFAFTQVSGALQAYSFSRREPSAPYHFTGARLTLERCAARPSKP